MTDSVLISEVGPRDGLQMSSGRMSTEGKRRWIDALAAAGLAEIEVGSFAPPKVLPMMADIQEVVAHALSIPNVTVAVLAPNAKGGLRAIAAGAHKITFPISVSASHSRSNVNMDPDAAVAQVAEVCRARDAMPEDRRPIIEGGLSTVFGCTIEGAVSEDAVMRLADLLVEAGADEIGLADTAGMADPAQMRRVIRKVRSVVGAKLDGVHLHNTNGLGLANAYAAYEEGITTFDSSLAGLGGCPFAPGASGNIVTEDLVHMFHRMGVKTGVDLTKLIAARDILATHLPGEPLYGFLPNLAPEARVA